MSSEVHPLPLVLPDKAQGQRGSSPLVTSANCPDGPASLVLFNTSRSVGVEGRERTGSCHLYSFTPTGSFIPPVTEPPAPPWAPHYTMRSHQSVYWKTISDNVDLKIGLLPEL